MTHTKLIPWNDFLKAELQDDKKAQYFLLAALEEYEQDDDIENFLLALRHIIDARGKFSDVAKKAKISRQHLYRILAKKSSPSFEIVKRIIKAVNLSLIYPQFAAHPQHSR